MDRHSDYPREAVSLIGVPNQVRAMELRPEEQSQDVSRSAHRPFHWYVDHGCCCVTAATYQHLTHFTDDELDFLCEELQAVAKQTEVELCGWTFQRNHYHLIATMSEGRALSRFAARFH